MPSSISSDGYGAGKVIFFDGLIMLPNRPFFLSAALRLRKLLDECGFPTDAGGQAAAVAGKLHVDMHVALELLSGLHPWSWDHLAQICEVFEKSPGFFLDPVNTGHLPSDTRLVVSAEGGESIAWRTPAGFSSQEIPSDARLRYIASPLPRFSADSPSICIFCLEEVPIARLGVGRNYVIEDDDGYEVMSLTSVSSNAVIFSSLDEKRGRVMSLKTMIDDDEEMATPRIAGWVVGTIVFH